MSQPHPHRRRAPSALLALLALLASAPAPAARHALLIGISDYAASGLRDLPGARQDLRLMADALKSRLRLQPGEIRTLLDAQATHTGMARAFAELATAARPGDFVYIHYSGHGSLTTDFNDRERTGKDQTLVPYGARRADSSGLDRYDILDDELNRWLGAIADKLGDAGELVVVADACHSASNTRGASALVSRAAPPDAPQAQASHPLAHGPSQRHPLALAVRIGAAGDEQSAYERRPQDGGPPAGLFTWYWAAALGRAEPGETWRQTFERAALGVSLVRGALQRPQLAGARADRPMQGGALPARPSVLASEVRGDTATLDAGRLAGVTPGSLYAAGEGKDAARVRILESGVAWSRGRIESGTLKAGDFLVERERAYESAPLRLCALPAQDARDRPLLEALRARLQRLPGFVWVEPGAAAPAEPDLALALLRPQRVAGEPRFAQTPKGLDTLPIPDPDAAPEVWVLNRGERLLHERLAVRLEPVAAGIETLAGNLERYRRVAELRRLTVEAGGQAGLEVALIRFDACAAAAPGCFRLPATGAWYRRAAGSEPIAALAGHTWPTGTLLSFALENKDQRERYAYLLELAPDGAIRTLYPPTGQSAETALLKPGERLDLAQEDVGLLLDDPGDLSLLALATRSPIDPRLLGQSGYEERISRGAGLGPLEHLLADAVRGSGAPGRTSLGTGSWGGALFDYRVEPPRAEHPEDDKR